MLTTQLNMRCNFFKMKNEQFDTILLMMNGIGIVGKLKNLDDFFQQLKKLLAPTGQVLLDSSDLRYLFDEDEDGGQRPPGNRRHVPGEAQRAHGELRTAEQVRQVGAPEQADEDVALAQVRMRSADCECQHGRDVEPGVHA
mgnify:CR=1 FL=1